jgi:hypothetical protein
MYAVCFNLTKQRIQRNRDFNFITGGYLTNLLGIRESIIFTGALILMCPNLTICHLPAVELVLSVIVADWIRNQLVVVPYLYRMPSKWW